MEEVVFYAEDPREFMFQILAWQRAFLGKRKIVEEHMSELPAIPLAKIPIVYRTILYVN